MFSWSFKIACFSISSVWICFSSCRISSGIVVTLIFTLAAASSSRSIALSGSFLSVIYLEERSTAESTASSVILIQWWVS